MTATHADQIIDGYLKRLDGELSNLPARRRKELTSQIAEHIAQARSELTEETDADLLTILDRVGEPDEIAAEARSRLDITTAKPGPLEIVALLLIGVGGVLFPILPVSWVVGTGLVWRSKAWTPRQKYLGAYLPLVLGLAILLVVALVSGLFGRHTSIAAFVLGVVVTNLVLPLVTAVRLGFGLGRRLPVLAWTAIAVVGLIVYLPAVASLIPIRTSAFIQNFAGSTEPAPGTGKPGCAGFYGTATYASGTPLAASLPVSVGVCWDGTRVRKTFGPDCFPNFSAGLRINVQSCTAQSDTDGSMVIAVSSSATATTAPFFTQSNGFEWRITPDGKVMGPP
jgi:hypothetical protein